jgi:hypothetical protein
MYLLSKFGDDLGISSGVTALSCFSKMATWWPYLKSDWAEIWKKRRWCLDTCSLINIRYTSHKNLVNLSTTVSSQMASLIFKMAAWRPQNRSNRENQNKRTDEGRHVIAIAHQR